MWCLATSDTDRYHIAYTVYKSFLAGWPGPTNLIAVDRHTEPNSLQTAFNFGYIAFQSPQTMASETKASDINHYIAFALFVLFS